MKRFQWRLQSVLDVKEKQEQLKRAELSQLDRQLEQFNRELNRQQRIVADLIDSLQAEDARTRMEKQGFIMAHITANDELILKLQDDINALRTRRKEAMDEVLELKKLTEGLSKLRSKAAREFAAEQEKRDQQASDEITTYRFARQRLDEQVVENTGA